MSKTAIVNHRSLLVGALATLALGALATTASAGDACRNVKFKFTNKHDSGRSIDVLKVKYFNKANGNWQTEDIKNTQCSQGATCTSDGDDLRDAEGEDLTKFRFVFKYQEQDGDWSDEVEGGDKVPTNARCTANKVYGPGSTGWTIFGVN